MKIEVRHEWRAIVDENTLTDGSTQFFAYHPSIPGVCAHGKTQKEAISNWKEALELAFAHWREIGGCVPKPTYLKIYVQTGDGQDTAVAPSGDFRVSLPDMSPI